MTITAQQLEKIEKAVDALYERADKVSDHLTEALIAVDDGEDAQPATYRTESALRQLAKDAGKAADAAHKIAFRAGSPLNGGKTAKALPKAKKSTKAKAAKAAKSNGKAKVRKPRKGKGSKPKGKAKAK